MNMFTILSVVCFAALWFKKSPHVLTSCCSGWCSVQLALLQSRKYIYLNKNDISTLGNYLFERTYLKIIDR